MLIYSFNFHLFSLIQFLKNLCFHLFITIRLTNALLKFILLLLSQDFLIELVVHHKNIIGNKTQFVTELLNAFHSIYTLLINLTTSIWISIEYCCTLSRLKHWLNIRNHCQITHDVDLVSWLSLFNVLISQNNIDRTRHRSWRNLRSILLNSEFLKICKNRMSFTEIPDRFIVTVNC